MGRIITAAAIQMQMSRSIEDNIEKADRMVREAAKEGAQVILLPELFERPYFCQERCYDYYAYAKPVEENDAVLRLQKTAKVVGKQTTANGGLASFANRYVVYQEGIYVGYKYYETRYEDVILGQGNASGSAGVFASKDETWNYADEVRYPFGYGLSYTTFMQKLDSVEYDANDDTFTAKVTVTNTGDRSGKTPVELYVQSPYTDYDREHGVEKAAIQLVGFSKTEELASGASETVTISFPRYLFASYDVTAHDGLHWLRMPPRSRRKN